MQRSGSDRKSVLELSVMNFIASKGLSAGFVDFLESRSLFLRAAIILTCWLGGKAQQLWPFSLVGRFLRANGLLFEGASAPSPILRESSDWNSTWATPRYDIVVVGSGPGGSVSALRHLENGKSVLLIEEGPDVATGLMAHHSVKQAQIQLRGLGFQVIYGTVPVAFAQGRTVGGGSEVNSGLYHRVPEPYRSRLLAAAGCSDTEWAALEAKVEHALEVQTAPPSFLSKYRDSARDFIAGSTARGLQVEEVARWRTYKPETHNGMKNTYIREFLKKGGRLVSQQKVTRLTEQSDHVRVETVSDAGRVTVRCDEVVVAAGAIETVRLLKNSGLVRRFRFPLVFHPMVRVLAEHSEQVNDDGHFPPYQSWDEANELKLGFSVSTFDYLKATYAALTGKVIDLETLPRLLSYFASFTLKDSRAFTFILAKKTFSWIFWGSADKQQISQARSTLENVLATGGAKEVVTDRGKPTVSTVHLFGSTPIGSSNVVDGRGKVTGTDRVYVCDSSLMPFAPWVNPQGPIMVLCELITSRKLSY